MMMAHDSSPGPTGLDDRTIEMVRTALAQYVSSSAGPESRQASSTDISIAHVAYSRPTPTREQGEPLRLALRAMAEEAREKSVLPESLLLLLKEIWHSLPSLNGRRDHEDQVAMLQRVVTMCIKEYYAD